MPATASASPNRRFEKPGLRDDAFSRTSKTTSTRRSSQLGDEPVDLTALVSDRHDDHRR